MEWTTTVRDNESVPVSGSYNLYETVANKTWMSAYISLKSVAYQWSFACAIFSWRKERFSNDVSLSTRIMHTLHRCDDKWGLGYPGSTYTIGIGHGWVWCWNNDARSIDLHPRGTYPRQCYDEILKKSAKLKSNQWSRQIIVHRYMVPRTPENFWICYEIIKLFYFISRERWKLSKFKFALITFRKYILHSSILYTHASSMVMDCKQLLCGISGGCDYD